MAQYYAYQLRATRPTMLSEGLNEQERESYGRHVLYLQRLVADGVAIFAGRARNAGSSGWSLNVIKAETEPAARQIMTDDPFVEDGVVETELFAFDIVLAEPKNARDPGR